jgi:diguanylate cyclase
LSYLRRFQFDKLKIDQIFIQTLSSERGGGSGSAAIIHNVVALGRSLGMTVQAEGVETLEHHIFLRAAGCHCLQGYYFAKPMSKSDFDTFFAKKRGFGYQDRYYA